MSMAGIPTLQTVRYGIVAAMGDIDRLVAKMLNFYSNSGVCHQFSLI